MSKRQEMLELAQKLADETIEREESKRLSSLLRQDASLREEYVAFLKTHAALCWEHRDASVREHSEGLLDRANVHNKKPRRRLLVWLTVAATVAFVTFVVNRYEALARDRAQKVVAAALKAHSFDFEHRYHASVTWENPLQAQLQPGSKIMVSTRGDEFWIGITGRQRLAIGKAPDESVWIALNEVQGVRIAPDEVGPTLRDLLQLHSLRLESMLSGILRDHDLQLMESSATTDTIVAKPTRMLGWIRNVLIEVDRESGRVLNLRASGRTLLRGRFTVDFQSEGVPTDGPSKYHLEEHLAPTASILTADQSREQRQEVLTRAFGLSARGWLVAPSDTEPDA
ncbi:MAG: hypothetical protein AAFX06_07320 [Planctomycetota bacterium]